MVTSRRLSRPLKSSLSSKQLGRHWRRRNVRYGYAGRLWRTDGLTPAAQRDESRARRGAQDPDVYRRHLSHGRIGPSPQLQGHAGQGLEQADVEGRLAGVPYLQVERGGRTQPSRRYLLGRARYLRADGDGRADQG